jgi:hypothetical protein
MVPLADGRPGLIIPNAEFHAYLNPWVAERADDPTHPGFDYGRFNVAHWQKFERLLSHARGWT